MSWTGRLEHVDIGTGAWVLRTGSGEKITLYGDVPKSLNGKDVQVDGEEVEAMGFAMVSAKAIRVSDIQER